MVEEKELLATQFETPKKKRIRDPLKKKDIKPQVIQDLNEIKPISRGEELIQNFQEEPKPMDISIYISTKEIKEKTSDDLEKTSKDNYVSVIKDGVEVIDVRAIEKAEENLKKGKVDKFGIPIGKDERRNFDKI